jgi:ATP-binding cassette subfamily B protein
MKNLMKYLKPFLLPILLLVAVTYGQVQAELALPGYMSDIVDTGIQYQGVEDNALIAISDTTYNNLQLFLDKDDKALINENYLQINMGDQEYLEQYPLLENQNVFVLDTINKDKIDEISTAMTMPLVYVSSLSNEQMLAGMNMTEEQVVMLIQNTEARVQYTNKIDEMLSTFSEDNLSSMSKVLVNQEYINLGIDTNARQSNYIYQIGLIMLLIAIGSAVFAILRTLISSIVATKLAQNLRKQIFEKIESFSNYEFTKFSTASLITRTTNDIQQVQQVTTMLLRMALYAPLMGVLAVLKVANYGSMLWIIGLIILIILIFMIVMMVVAVPKFKKIQKLVDSLNRVMRERLSNNLVVRAFNTQLFEENNFDKVNIDTKKLNIFVNRIQALMMPFMMFIMNASTVLIIWVGANQIDAGVLEIGELMAFIQYVMQVLFSFMFLTVIFMMIPRLIISINRIAEVLNTDISILDKENTQEIPEGNKVIEFKNVSFRYPNAKENVLTDISFTANPGESIAIVGSTGSGKSTLLNLIPRFFDASEGSVSISKIDVKDVKMADLRDNIGYIPQKANLFKGTIESNLRYANENISINDLNKAIDIAKAREFIDSKELGIQELVSQCGSNFSGGQKQRLSIARALCKDAAIYLFDDSLSALDFKTATKLTNELNKLVNEKKATVFTVAQRVSSIMTSDKIIVLEEGKIVGIGKHEELLKDCKVYQEIASSQLSKGELTHE